MNDLILAAGIACLVLSVIVKTGQAYIWLIAGFLILTVVPACHLY